MFSLALIAIFLFLFLFLVWKFRYQLLALFAGPPDDPLAVLEAELNPVNSQAFGKRAVPPASPAGQDSKSAGPTGA